MFSLGEENNLEAYIYLREHNKHANSIEQTEEFIKGAAYSGSKNLLDIMSILEISNDKTRYIPSAYYYAAKGGLYNLIKELIGLEKTNGDGRARNITNVCAGAAEGNYWNIFNEFYQLFKSEDRGIWIHAIEGAANSGNQEFLDKIRKTQDAGQTSPDNISDMIIKHAAKNGHTAMVIHELKNIEKYTRMSNRLEVIRNAIGGCIVNGHNELTYELLARAELYTYHTAGTNQILLKNALCAAIEADNETLSKHIISSGIDDNNIAAAIYETMRNDDWQERIQNFFRNLNDPDRCFRIAQALEEHVKYTHDWSRHQNAHKDIFPIIFDEYDIKGVSKEALKLYLNNNVHGWIRTYSELKDKGELNLPRDLAHLITQHALNLGKHVELKLDPEAFKGACTLAQQIAMRPKQQNQIVKPFEPSKEVKKIRREVLGELNAYIKTTAIAHKERAQALATCISKAVTVESIYSILQTQADIMNGTYEGLHQRLDNDPVSILYKQPNRTGHSKLSIFTPKSMADYLTRVENCLRIVENYRAPENMKKLEISQGMNSNNDL